MCHPLVSCRYRLPRGVDLVLRLHWHILQVFFGFNSRVISIRIQRLEKNFIATVSSHFPYEGNGDSLPLRFPFKSHLPPTREGRTSILVISPLVRYEATSQKDCVLPILFRHLIHVFIHFIKPGCCLNLTEQVRLMKLGLKMNEYDACASIQGASSEYFLEGLS